MAINAEWDRTKVRDADFTSKWITSRYSTIRSLR
jgi:hypothetical protein